jgi:hypothetical protein
MNVLKGIVHYSDYNIDVVLQSIQVDILKFENNLRKLLFLNGLNNRSVIDYLETKLTLIKNDKEREFQKKRLANYKKSDTKMSVLGPFQIFYINDLLLFSNSTEAKKIFKIFDREFNGKSYQSNIIINDLRNMAMHGKNPIEKNYDTNVYSLDSLKFLLFSLKILRESNGIIEDQINQNIDYKSAVMIENRSKLVMISKHKLKAINYFLSR